MEMVGQDRSKSLMHFLLVISILLFVLFNLRGVHFDNCSLSVFLSLSFFFLICIPMHSYTRSHYQEHSSTPPTSYTDEHPPTHVRTEKHTRHVRRQNTLFLSFTKIPLIFLPTLSALALGSEALTFERPDASPFSCCFLLSLSAFSFFLLLLIVPFLYYNFTLSDSHSYVWAM